jgi:hypothetical protein
MGKILKGIGIIVGLFIFLALLGAMFGSHDSTYDKNTKTAYSQDGKNFVSKERMDENIKYGYAKVGDYKEVQVPLNTVVVGASVIPDETSNQEEKATQTREQSSTPKQTTTSIAVSATPQSVIDSKIAEKLVKYDAIKEAIVKDNVIMISVADSSQAGKESALRTIANVLMYGYISTDTKDATFYTIYLEEKMLDGSYYDVGQSAVYSYEIEDAIADQGSIAAKLTLGDKMIARLSKK